MSGKNAPPYLLTLGVLPQTQSTLGGKEKEIQIMSEVEFLDWIRL